MEDRVKRPRARDTSSAEARRALESALRQFGGWRSDLASFAALADRRPGAADREAMLARCEAIEAELLGVRTALILDLADAPPKVAGHSRVVDVEKALDGIAAQTAELRRQLSP